MTPDERMKLFTLVAEYDGCENTEAFDKLQAVKTYVEDLERAAYMRGVMSGKFGL